MTPFPLVKQLAAIAVGAAIMGLGLNAFNIANHLAEGGITGISILLKLWLDLDPGLTVLVLNIPLLVWGIYMLGWRASSLSIYGVMTLSFWLWLFDEVRMPLTDPLLAAIYAGVAVGIGVGIIFRFGGTTGGIDIVVRVLNRKFGWSTGRVMFALDVVVLAGSMLYLDIHQVMYTLIAVFIGGRLLDLVESGAYRAKAMMVMSSASEPITRAVLEELERGVTILKAVGAYTKQDREALYIVCSHAEVMRVKAIIHQADPRAFVTIHDITEVIGEGFARQN